MFIPCPHTHQTHMNHCALSPLMLLQNLKHFQKLPSFSAKTKLSPLQLSVAIRALPTIASHRCPSVTLGYAFLLLFLSIFLNLTAVCVSPRGWLSSLVTSLSVFPPDGVSAVDPTLLPRQALIYVSAFPKFTSWERLSFVSLPHSCCQCVFSHRSHFSLNRACSVGLCSRL